MGPGARKVRRAPRGWWAVVPALLLLVVGGFVVAYRGDGDNGSAPPGSSLATQPRAENVLPPSAMDAEARNVIEGPSLGNVSDAVDLANKVRPLLGPVKDRVTESGQPVPISPSGPPGFRGGPVELRPCVAAARSQAGARLVVYAAQAVIGKAPAVVYGFVDQAPRPVTLLAMSPGDCRLLLKATLP